MLLSTHLQALSVDADHHPCVLTLHTEPNVQGALVLLGLAVIPHPVVEGEGYGRVGAAFRIGRREGKGQTGALRNGSSSWLWTGVTQDGELWKQHALQRIHHI